MPAAQEVRVVNDGGLANLGVHGPQDVQEVPLDPAEAAPRRVAVAHRPGDADDPGFEPHGVEQAEQLHGAVLDLHLACRKGKTEIWSQLKASPCGHVDILTACSSRFEV